MTKRNVAMLTGLLLCTGVLLTACAGNGEEPATVTTTRQVVTVEKVTTTTEAPTASQPTTTTAETQETTTTAYQLPEGETGSDTGNAVAACARSLIGTPYAPGGNDPETGFNNPNFVAYCYAKEGVTVPRSAAQLALYGQDVPPDELKIGDILVFCNEPGEDPGFVGIYLGNNEFAAACNPEKPTSIEKLTVSYWSARFIAARRP